MDCAHFSEKMEGLQPPPAPLLLTPVISECVKVYIRLSLELSCKSLEQTLSAVLWLNVIFVAYKPHQM